MYLEKGIHTIRFTSNANDFNINWIEIHGALNTGEQLFADYETISLNFNGSGSSTFKEVVNPSQSGINLSANVGENNRGVESSSGIVSDVFSSKIDFSVNHVFTLKVYSPEKCSVKLKTEVSSNTNIFREETANITTANEWQELTFDFTGAPSNTFDRMVLYFNYGSTSTATYYFDDISLQGGNITSLSNNEISQSLTSVNVYPNPTNTGFVNIESKQTINSVALFDLQGSLFGSNMVNENKASVDTSNLNSGIYLLRVNTQDGYQIIKIIVE